MLQVVAVLAVARMRGVTTVRSISAVGGVTGAGVCAEVSGVAMPGVTMSTVPTVSIMSHVGEAADRHRDEARTTQR